MNKKFELLAPAGSMEHVFAAVQNGADAVYLGGKTLNARINASNFSLEEMEKAIDYAHLRDVKIFVTVNTLVKDEELAEAVEYCHSLYRIGADAVIVQDIGLGYLLKKYVPKLPLHFSTQGTIYNLPGVRAAQKLGFERVVLARELSLGEIKECCGSGYPEIEVFVHGALCICYSGQCSLSRVNGGRSGNRGLCAQPCRLKYTSETGEAKHWLSPKDLCTVDGLGELMEAGVKSFKIEGRMKSPEYVAAVTGIYRKYMDTYAEKGYYSVSAEDRRTLSQIFNRGGFTSGYLRGDSSDRIMSFAMPKHQGIYIGNVLKRVDGNVVEIKLNDGEELRMGDGVEIHAKGLPGNVVTYMREDRNDRRRLRIGDIKGSVRGGEKVFKITDKRLMENLRETFAQDGAKNRDEKRTPLVMSIRLREGKAAKLIAAEQANSDMRIELTFDDILPEKAINKPLAAERIKEQLGKCGEYPYYPAECDVDADEGITVPMSALNRMRREALQVLYEKKRDSFKHEDVTEARRQSLLSEELQELTLLREGSGVKKSRLTVHLYDDGRLDDAGKRLAAMVERHAGRISEAVIKVPVVSEAWRAERAYADGIELLPYIANVTRGSLDEYINERFGDITEALGERRIYIGNPSWLAVFAEAGANTVADYGLNVANGAAARAAASELGAHGYVQSLEFDEGACGYLPLMTAEHMVKAERLKDAKGHELCVRELQGASQSVIARGLSNAEAAWHEAEELIGRVQEISVFL